MTIGHSKKKKTLSASPLSVRTYADDWVEIQRIARSEKLPEATLVRELVREALHIRRLRKSGQDAVTRFVRDAQREVVREELKPLFAEIEKCARAQSTTLAVCDAVHNKVQDSTFLMRQLLGVSRVILAFVDRVTA